MIRLLVLGLLAAALLASRVAEVAQKRTRAGGTPWRRMVSANGT